MQTLVSNGRFLPVPLLYDCRLSNDRFNLFGRHVRQALEVCIETVGRVALPKDKA